MKLALGTMRLSGTFNGLMVLDRDAERASEVLTVALDRGITAFDTAPIYARGAAEEDLGRALSGSTATEVWTKVGVDIDGVLPTVDYGFDAVRRSLDGSVRRLKDAEVTRVFVHNAPTRLLAELPYADVSAELARLAPRATLGVSIRVLEDLDVLLESAPPGLPVMVELWHLEQARPAVVDELRRRPLVVRSLFRGGDELRHAPPDSVPGIIRARLDDVAAAYGPEWAVIAPSTREQLVMYPARRS